MRVTYNTRRFLAERRALKADGRLHDHAAMLAAGWVRLPEIRWQIDRGGEQDMRVAEVRLDGNNSLYYRLEPNPFHPNNRPFAPEPEA